MMSRNGVPGMDSTYNDRFLATTRGQVALLLRGGDKTVNELASALNLTDNAVRAHLAALQRDQLVRQGPFRKGASKPSATFTLTAAAERLFPKSYGAVLNALLRVLVERRPSAELDETLREAGHRMPVQPLPADASPAARAARATELLAALGGSTTVAQVGNTIVITGADCPLAAAVEATPSACLFAEALLSDAVGAPVRQVCDNSHTPHCRFEIDLAEDELIPDLATV